MLASQTSCTYCWMTLVGSVLSGNTLPRICRGHSSGCSVPFEGGGRNTPSVTSRCGSLLASLSADACAHLVTSSHSAGRRRVASTCGVHRLAVSQHGQPCEGGDRARPALRFPILLAHEISAAKWAEPYPRKHAERRASAAQRSRRRVWVCRHPKKHDRYAGAMLLACN